MDYVTDTHSIVWYFTDDPRLSRRALEVFEKTIKEGAIIIPAVVLAEIMYIADKGKISRRGVDEKSGILSWNYQIVVQAPDFVINRSFVIRDAL